MKTLCAVAGGVGSERRAGTASSYSEDQAVKVEVKGFIHVDHEFLTEERVDKSIFYY